jgi:hypothetical protein
MKKIIFTIAVLLTSAYAYGVLTGSQTNGLNKICFYSDGSAITVSSSSICPVSNDY